MNSTPTNTSRPTAVQEFEEIAPVFGSPRVAGPSALFLVGPWLLLVLLLVPPVAVLFTVVLAVVLLLAAAGAAVAVVASPFLLVRAIHRRLAERESSEALEPTAGRTAQTGAATPKSGLPALAHQRP